MATSEYLEQVSADVVEWPRLSQAVRLEREAATSYYSVCDIDGAEKGIFYTFESALRFGLRYDFPQIDKKRILKEVL